MNRLKLAFAIFWRMLALNMVMQYTAVAFLMFFLNTPLSKYLGANFFMFKPSIAYVLFALVLYALCNIKFLKINRFIWKRVYVIPVEWIDCYKAYIKTLMVLAFLNMLVISFFEVQTWVNYKLLMPLIFLVIPIVLAYKQQEN